MGVIYEDIIQIEIMYNLILGLYKLRNTMTHLSVDVVQEIASYLDMPTLRKMIDLSDRMEPSIGNVFALEFYRRGEKFVNWVNSLRVVREVTDEISETTYISESIRIIQSISQFGDYSLSHTIMLDRTEMKSTRSWNAQGMMTLSHNFKNGQFHGLCEKWNDEGVKTSSVNCKHNSLHGLCEEWDDRGMKIRSENYKDGKFHGLRQKWNDRGVKTFSGNYKDGIIQIEE